LNNSNYTGGGSLGNSWRIAGDGSGWGPLSNCANQQAASAVFAGPGAWPDPDLLIGPQVYVGGQTDEQARAQFTLWSIFPTNLLISQNVLAWSDYALETYSNAEVIALNRDALMSPARRIAGGDLKFPCTPPTDLAGVVAADCDAADASQQWDWAAAGGVFSPRLFPGGVLAATQCGAAASGSPVVVANSTTGGGCATAARWSLGSDGTVTNAGSGMCLDIYDWVGPVVDVWTCNGGSNQKFAYDSTTGLLTDTAGAGPNQGAKCLSAVPSGDSCSNVWGRRLADGYALAFVNNDAARVTVTCDASCFAALNVSATTTALTVRDLWKHEDVATITPPFSFSSVVNASGAATAYKLTPA
jgi:hypothetical protein